MNEPVIDLQGVSKSFGRTRVLDGLSLRVERGQTFAFLGRNGAGKTTTIRLLMGLLKRDDGAVRVLGLDPQTAPLKLRARVGYLAEDQTMYGWMTVEELVRFTAAFYPTWDHDLALRRLREFELPLRTKVGRLSKGQKVRVGLVLALAHRPELVVLDDPALGLDPIMRKQFNRDLVSHMQGAGTTIFYSSHLLDEVEPVADAVAILDAGRLVRQADTDTLRADVKQIVVARDAGALFEGDRVLDRRTAGDELAVVVENAERVCQRLAGEGAAFRVVDLNLDEIFEAYVVGRPEAEDGTTNRIPIAAD
ncbi:ABC transporter ATP-binding protein YtrB [Pirellulimonas nuda]|uniref:ABC transporter ATP-binding protein YtrB n=1 Tax=Pirellulimonas nuda TaxID=2528009 RepID=A0A518DJI0_9BACT|nr:ABC transporter ATP-binding protein [Pirellulimonas nuda]QDU91637.1 ABC transporter ATP-binding protein YtrB [Pirellulimonas nuda]